MYDSFQRSTFIPKYSSDMVDKYIYKKISEYFPYEPTEEQQKAIAAIAAFAADTTPR